MFRKFRIAVLLIILATVAVSSWRDSRRLGAWDETLRVAVYPMAGDDSPVSRRYIASLSPAQLEEISTWLHDEGARYGLALGQPLDFSIVPGPTSLPPAPPEVPSLINTVVWSLHLRYWSWRHQGNLRPKPHIRLFVIFHDPERQARLAHSTGLSKGQIGLIHVFASPTQQGQNNVVIAHELMHIFGARDKYNPSTLFPDYPDGFAEPERTPRLPQRRAEIMAGRIPISPDRAEIPDSLDDAVIGPASASEISWLRR